jgi:hypothetical protein
MTQFEWRQSLTDKWVNGSALNRKGCTWSHDELRHLLKGYLYQGLDIVALAKRHNRGVLGVANMLSRILDNPAKKELLLSVDD